LGSAKPSAKEEDRAQKARIEKVLDEVLSTMKKVMGEQDSSDDDDDESMTGPL
jgi:hypothetical protein